MPNPLEVSISANGFTPCNVTLYKSNPGDSRPNSVKWTNNATSDVSWNCNSAGSFLATTAPPNNSNPASPNATISAGQSLTLWVKDSATTNSSVSYTLELNGAELSCISRNPPEILIEP